jgi:hypothetical protein
MGGGSVETVGAPSTSAPAQTSDTAETTVRLAPALVPGAGERFTIGPTPTVSFKPTEKTPMLASRRRWSPPVLISEAP